MPIDFGPDPDDLDMHVASSGVRTNGAVGVHPSNSVDSAGGGPNTILSSSAHPLRHRLEELFRHRFTESILACLVLLSLATLVEATDTKAVDGGTPLWLEVVDGSLLAIFVLEAGARIYTFRWHILEDRWSMFDLFVVGLDLAMSIFSVVVKNMPSFLMMRIVRLLRVARTTKLTQHIPQLHIIVLSLSGALETLFWGTVMIALMLVATSILAVQLIDPIIQEIVDQGGFQGCDRCKRSYQSVWRASLTTIQAVICGDSWGMVTLPVIEHSPWTLAFFACVFIVFSLALLNIIMANIVDAVMQARTANDALMANVRRKERQDAKMVIYNHCKALDADNSGSLTYDEFKRGYEKDPGFRQALNAMDVRTEDLDTVWVTLDEDNSGDVSYHEFCDQLYKMKYSDGHTLLMIIKAVVQDLRNKLKEEIRLVSQDVLGSIKTIKASVRVNEGLDEKILQHVQELESKTLELDGKISPKAPDMDMNSCNEPDGPNAFSMDSDSRQRASDHARLSAAHQHLEQLKQLNVDLEQKLRTFSTWVSSEFRPGDLATPMLVESSSPSKEGTSAGRAEARSNEGASARHERATDVSRAKNDLSRTVLCTPPTAGEGPPRSDVYPAFAMCCSVGPPRSNVGTVIREPAPKSAEKYRSLVGMPNGLSTPQQDLTSAGACRTPVATDEARLAARA